ncbi:OmpA-like domain-containing protein [Thauera humireducens]|uniref:OmpA family protein n=1 Tax=Thauera humireducens TaxID=1134435 RepID=UPI002467A17B|nr:OmpA family protein [Thauera humireducens]CAH1747521.1 OmpA-like domain-containing protein [Thauera humireducens]
MKRKTIPILALAIGLASSACTNMSPLFGGSTTAPAPSAPAQAAAPAPPPILPFDDAVLAAANDVFARAGVPAGTERVALVIDPLVDGMAGEQTAATRAMGERIAELARSRYPHFEILPFDSASLRRAPWVLVGTFTPVSAEGRTEGSRAAYRICLALADLGSGRIVSKGLARSQLEGVDGTPLASFRDSPAWVRDPRVEAYIRTCQGTKAGDPIQPAYLDGILTASLISQAVEAYNAGRYREALERYEAAEATPAGRQLRVLNGLYLANTRLGHAEAAGRAFGRLVDFGLEQQRLAVKFLFRPGSTGFVAERRLSGAYPMWLAEIARGAAAREACLEVAGHASRSGPEPLNERLSLLRAEAVRGLLVANDARLTTRTIAAGYGSREAMVGTGRDDASDAMDRRVEFRVVNCAPA